MDYAPGTADRSVKSRPLWQQNVAGPATIFAATTIFAVVGDKLSPDCVEEPLVGSWRTLPQCCSAYAPGRRCLCSTFLREMTSLAAILKL